MRHPGSFRDPAGFIFTREGKLLRQVNTAGQDDYDALMSSGLYELLTAKGLLIKHREVDEAASGSAATPERYRLLEPKIVPFISYPYEWGFSQLKDAALTTLRIQKLALSKGMVLKDASAYNIQFYEGRPVLIDTLSFAKYKAGEPWQAYKQFCQHFLAPLALGAKVDIGLLKLLATHIDGLPLPLVAKLLPRRAWLSPGLLMHLNLHARAQAGRSKAGTTKSQPTLSRTNLEAVIESLTRTIKSLNWRPGGTEWGDYYSFTNYTDAAFEDKKRLVALMLIQAGPKTVWDMGGNTGEFSRIAAAQGAHTVCLDIDPVAVERNYLATKQQSETNLLPVLFDLANPSPAIGWANNERFSLAQRGSADLIMALALIHHLAISNNLPLEDIAAYFASLGEYLIIEFVPKGDSKVDILLATRTDIFPNYTQAGFEAAFGRYYQVSQKHPIKGTQRMLYLMQRAAV